MFVSWVVMSDVVVDIMNVLLKEVRYSGLVVGSRLLMIGIDVMMLWRLGKNVRLMVSLVRLFVSVLRLVICVEYSL